MKKLIWIMGSMSSGKSTLRRNLCKVLTPSNGNVLTGICNKLPYIITEFDDIAIIGEATESSACDGLDKSFGHLKKEGGLNSVAVCLRNYDITILEGSQTASTWIEELEKLSKKYKAEFHVIYLNLTLWQNFNRLLNRIQERGKTEADMTDKRLESVRSKNKQFKGVYDKCLLLDSIICNQVEVGCLSEEETLLEVINILRL